MEILGVRLIGLDFGTATRLLLTFDEDLERAEAIALAVAR